ncbi:MAG TPA: hypothetical protein VGG28_01425 [Kofleriaceae bacterium]|jgi:hypothetical protein
MFATTDDLRALVQRAIDHALPTAGDGFHVFVMTTGAHQPSFMRFITSVVEGQAEARKHVVNVAKSIDRFAIAYDGAITLDSGRVDAIFVEAGEHGNHEYAVYAAPYRDGALVGERLLVQTLPSLLTLTEAPNVVQTMIVKCEGCGQKNRIKPQSPANPICGKCKQPLR